MVWGGVSAQVRRSLCAFISFEGGMKGESGICIGEITHLFTKMGCLKFKCETILSPMIHVHCVCVEVKSTI